MKTFVLSATLTVGIVAGGPTCAASAINPDSGPIGIAVTITGEGFGKFVSTKDNAVLFGKKKAPGLVEQWEDGRIIVRVPRKAATGPVVVKSGKGCKDAPPEAVMVMAAITPEATEGPMGSPVVMTGRGFGQRKPGEDAVLFKGNPAAVLQ